MGSGKAKGEGRMSELRAFQDHPLDTQWCRKCGEDRGWKVRFASSNDAEWLEWSCLQCGFIIQTKTRDAIERGALVYQVGSAKG